MNEKTMETLVRAAAEGDESSFNELYRRTRNQAYFVAYSITKSEEDALDILQDSYLKAWKNLSRLKEPEKFTSWFNQIAANTAKTFVTKRKPLLFTDEEELLQWEPEREDAYIPHESMDTEETRRLIMDIVYSLPEDQRLAVLLYYYEDMPVAEMAAALGIPLNTVKNRLYLARKKISNGVEDLEKTQGVKLYSAAPVPLLIWVLKRLRLEEYGDKLPPVILTGGAAAGGIFAALTLPKIIAAIAAASIVVGGSVAAVTTIRRGKALPVVVETTITAAVPTQPAMGKGIAYGYPELPAPINETYANSYSQPVFARQDTSHGIMPTHSVVSSGTASQIWTTNSAKSSLATTETATRGIATTKYIYTQRPTITQATTRTTAAKQSSAASTTMSTTTSKTTTATTTTTSTSTTTTTFTTTATIATTTTTMSATTTAAQLETTASPASAFSYYSDAGGVVIDDYVGAESVVVIPSVIDGLPVIKIFDQAFQGATVTEVYIPSGVEEIGNAAFRNCASLTKLVVPASVITLGFAPFNNCPTLTIYCPPGSVVYQHAVQNGIPVA